MKKNKIFLLKKIIFLKKMADETTKLGMGNGGVGDWGFTIVYISANSSLIVGIPNLQSPLV